MKPTPGPWSVRDHTTPSGSRHIWVEGGPPIGQTRAGPYKRQILEDEDYPEKRADADLVASAHTMAAELEHLRAVIVEAGRYAAVCPVPSGLATEARAELSDTRHRIAAAAAQTGPPRLIQGALDMAAEIERLRELAYAPDGKEHRSMLFEEAAKRLPLQEEIERLQTYQDETAKAWTKLTESQEQEIAELRKENADMLEALKDLHADCVEYARINNLHNSDGSPATHHSMRRSAAAIASAEASSILAAERQTVPDEVKR